jgi:hypothetical protein
VRRDVVTYLKSIISDRFTGMTNLRPLILRVVQTNRMQFHHQRLFLECKNPRFFLGHLPTRVSNYGSEKSLAHCLCKYSARPVNYTSQLCTITIRLTLLSGNGRHGRKSIPSSHSLAPRTGLRCRCRGTLSLAIRQQAEIMHTTGHRSNVSGRLWTTGTEASMTPKVGCARWMRIHKPPPCIRISQVPTRHL